MQNLLKRHVNALRSRCQGSPKFVIMTESNLGLEAAHIANFFREEPRCVCLRETGPEGRFGVLTTHGRKFEFAALLEQYLMQQAITICNHVVSDDAPGAVRQLETQLLNYRMVSSSDTTLNAFSNTRVTLSGKVGANGKITGGAMQDDLCIALQLAIFWSSYVLQRKCNFLDYNRFFAQD